MENVNASTSTRRMTTKIDRKVASNERMLSTKSQNLLKKNVILHFHETYGHQTLQNGGL